MADGCAKGTRERHEKSKARACEGKASIPGDHAAVRFDEGAILRTGEEHGACHHALRAVESVVGTTAAVGDDGIVATAEVKE